LHNAYYIWYLLIYLPKYVPRPGDSKGTFRSSNQISTCNYQPNYSKGLVEGGIPVKCFAQGHNKRTCRAAAPTSRCFNMVMQSSFLAGLSVMHNNLPAYRHTIPLMLYVKQGSCEYKLFKYLV